MHSSFDTAEMQMDYANYDLRVTSFGNITGRDESYYHLLAAAGFYNAGLENSARCHFCGLGLRYRPELDPVEQHAALNSNCHFLQEQRGHAFVQELQKRHQFDQSINRRDRYHDNTEEPCFCQDDDEQPSVIDNTNDKPETSQQSSVLHTNTIYEAGARPKVPAATSSSATIGSKSDIDNVQKIICKICFTREVEILFLPCRHLVCCGVCASACTMCVMCQQQIEEQKRAYLP